jgi:alpha-L-fucosidase
MPKKATQKKRTDWFVHDRLGLFIHWGTYALAARHEWVKNFERIKDKEYMKYFDHFYPDMYNPAEWAKQAKDAGMKYFVITTKHHEGFCLWDSKYTDYKATKTPWGRDVLRPMVEAFRAEGFKVGFYYSLLDWHHPEFPIDRMHPRRDDAKFREKAKNRDVRKYADYLHKQVEELLTKFGKIDVIWYDYSYPSPDGKGHEDWQSEKLIELTRMLQPNILINNRLDVPDAPDFVTPEQYQPSVQPVNAKGKPVVWEGCQTFSGSWGYHRDELTWKSVDMLIGMLVDSVSKNGNMLLNVGPTARGEFDPRAKERLAQMGKWMKYCGRAIYGCGAAPKGLVPPPDCRYTYNRETKRLYLHFLAWPFKAVNLAGLAKRLAYAQFLHDSSEVVFHGDSATRNQLLSESTPSGSVTLELPTVKPDVTIPVVELFLKR